MALSSALLSSYEVALKKQEIISLGRGAVPNSNQDAKAVTVTIFLEGWYRQCCLIFILGGGNPNNFKEPSNPRSFA